MPKLYKLDTKTVNRSFKLDIKKALMEVSNNAMKLIDILKNIIICHLFCPLFVIFRANRPGNYRYI